MSPPARALGEWQKCQDRDGGDIRQRGFPKHAVRRAWKHHKRYDRGSRERIDDMPAPDCWLNAERQEDEAREQERADRSVGGKKHFERELRPQVYISWPVQSLTVDHG
jgi:hypothetical protein